MRVKKRSMVAMVLVAALALVTVIPVIPATAASKAGVETRGEALVADGNILLRGKMTDAFTQKIQAKLDNPPVERAIESRWWLAEGLNTDATIKKEIKMLHEAGWGALEIVCMSEQGAPDELYAWGSEEWSHDIQLIISECTKYGMGFSLTSGTHWGNANLPVEALKPDDRAASKELDYTIEVVSGKNRLKVVVGSTLKNRLTQMNIVSPLPNPVEPSYGQRASYGMTGEVKLVHYGIGKTDLSDAGRIDLSLPANKIGVTAVPNKAYTGKQIKPALTVSANGKKLTLNTDYTVTFGVNKNIGRGTVILTGKGGYKGKKTVYFKIVPVKPVISTAVRAGKGRLKVTRHSRPVT